MMASMRTIAALAFFAVSMQISARAVTIPTLAGVLSMAASSGQIVREGHDLFKHPWKTLKHHGTQIKEAAQGKRGTIPPPNPYPIQFPPGVEPVGATGVEGSTGPEEKK